MIDLCLSASTCEDTVIDKAVDILNRSDQLEKRQNSNSNRSNNYKYNANMNTNSNNNYRYNGNMNSNNKNYQPPQERKFQTQTVTICDVNEDEERKQEEAFFFLLFQQLCFVTMK